MHSLTVNLFVHLSVFLEDITNNFLFCIVPLKLCRRQKGLESSLETTSSIAKASDTTMPGVKPWSLIYPWNADWVIGSLVSWPSRTRASHIVPKRILTFVFSCSSLRISQTKKSVNNSRIPHLFKKREFYSNSNSNSNYLLQIHKLHMVLFKLEMI